jgi:hypothetical protein
MKTKPGGSGTGVFSAVARKVWSGMISESRSVGNEEAWLRGGRKLGKRTD